jgi:hypothetical protein
MNIEHRTGPRDFWKSAGYHLTERSKNGWLAVTPDILRAYVTRPEVHPVEESCDTEHRIFEALMTDPLHSVSEADLAAIQDPDAADNYRIVLRFRDLLVAAGSIEAGYANLFGQSPVQVPPVFIDQLVHLILRSVLERETDPMQIRAAELLFRDQKFSSEGGQILLADTEIIEMMSETGGLGGLGALLVESGTPMQSVTLDVMTEDNAATYWDRSDRFDMAIDFRFAEPAQDAFARVLERWVEHMTSVPVRIQPMQSIKDERWSWHIGLDADATRILNALYRGEDLHPDETGRIVGLFRLEALDRSVFRQSMRGKPVYLGLAMDERHNLKVKPQNLLNNLPLTAAE